MRRARESDDLEEERPKKQANLGLFFRQADGSPLTPPAPPQLHRLSCPYCELSLESQHHASLPGSLRAHVQWRHPDDFFEASTRLQAALSSARGSIFDIVAMPPIPEEEMDDAAEELDEGEAEDEEDELAAELSAPPSTPGLLPSPFVPKNAIRKRYSYTLKQKFKVLQALEKTEALVRASLADASLFFAVTVLDTVTRETGIPSPTLKKWVSAKDKIRETYLARKRARKSRRLGSGRTALFPKAEAIVTNLVRERRRECKLVSKAFVLKHLKLEAEKEDAANFAKAKFSPELVNGFMRRGRFSLRYPSCIRSDDLASAVLICRAFHRQLLQILADDGEVKFAKKPLHPSFGRFRLRYRFNGDELPYRFGRVRSIVSETNESLTHVAWPPGWEARLATLFLMADATGRIVITAVIFKGALTPCSLSLNTSRLLREAICAADGRDRRLQEGVPQRARLLPTQGLDGRRRPFRHHEKHLHPPSAGHVGRRRRRLRGEPPRP